MNVQVVGIITKHNDSDIREIAYELSEWFTRRHISTRIDRIEADMDMLVILGGDGTLLHVAASASHYDIPVVGINLGNLGFLTEVAADEMYQALETILKGDLKIENRMMLRARLISSPEREMESLYFALNEVVIVKGNMERVVHLSCWVDDEYITTYKADGLIVSTPTGSTAYNLSAGGPIVQPELDAILLTPICPFMLESRPVLFSSQKKVKVQLAERVSDIKVIIDGRYAWDIGEKEYLVVEAAPKSLRLISSPHKGYFDILRNKLNWGGRDKQYCIPSLSKNK